LLDLLRNLKATGWSGLEGLVGATVARQLGLRARTEGSGRQHGRDVGLFDAEGRSAGIDIETKRYAEGRTVQERELLGEITETMRARPDTRTWIVAATTPVHAAVAEAIVDEGYSRSVDVVVLDVEPGGLGPLQVLLASQADETLAWVAAHDPAHLADWRTAIEAVRSQPAFSLVEQDVAVSLSGRYATPGARERAHAWLFDRLRADRTRQQEFNQRLGRTGRAPAIDRPRLQQELERWHGRQAQGQGVLALLGGEGDGKTWTALDLLRKASDRIPLVITANLYDDGGAASLLAHAFVRQCGGDYDAWRNRLENTQRFPKDFRLMVLVDGLNEAPHFRTSEMLSELLNASFASQLELIVTCRTPFWENRVLPGLDDEQRSHQFIEIEVGPFDHQCEWPAARLALGAGAKDLPDKVEAALHNPRLWSFAYHLKDRLGGLHEISLENLLVEHWKMRRAERTDIAVDDQTFNRLVARSVQDLRKQGEVADGTIDHGRLDALLREMSGHSDYSRDLAEISDGVFYSSGIAGSLQLKANRVPVALGLLLADDMLVAATKSNPGPAMRRAAAALLDDLPANDEIETIIRTGVFALLSLPKSRRAPLPTLLRHWVGWQNREDDFDRALSIAAGRDPDAFLRAIEEDSQDDEVVGAQIQTDLLRGVLSRHDLPGYASAVEATASRWMGSLPQSRFAGQDLDQSGVALTVLDWVQTLDDAAATLLTYLPPARWAKPLAAWARRRAYLDAVGPSDGHNDHHLSWLCFLLTHEDDVLAHAPAYPPMSEAAREHLQALLDGRLFATGGLFVEELGPWGGAVKQAERLADGAGVEDPEFADLYGGKGTGLSSQWMQLEGLLLATAPHRIAPLVRALVAACDDDWPFNLVQIQRDHALLLGSDNLAITHRIMTQLDMGGRKDRNLGIYAAHAIEATLAFAPAATAPEILKGLQASTKELGQIDASALPDPGDEALLDLFGTITQALDPTAFALLQLTARRPAPTKLVNDKRFQALLMKAAAGPPPWSTIALRTALCAEDPTLRRLLASRPVPADQEPPPVTQELRAELALNGDERSYRVLRDEVGTERLARAAERDGRDKAIADFRADFDLILRDAAGGDWPGSLTPGVAAPLPGARKGRGRRGRATFPRIETRRAIDLITTMQPGYVESLAQRLDQVADETLIVLESRTGLISVMADLLLERATPWMTALVADPARIEFRGLMVSSATVFAFVQDHPGARGLRDQIAEASWSDGELCDLVCMADLTGRGDWLSRWIAREDQVGDRLHHARAMILRGWRGEPADAEALAAVAGFGAKIADIAKARLERLALAREGLARFATEQDDVDAWLGYRRMCQAADRRIYVGLSRLDEGTLSPSRRAQLRLFRSDTEKLIGGNESTLAEMFASVAFPKLTRPWDPLPLYGAAGEAAS